MNITEIETILRHAPKPTPPACLKDELLSGLERVSTGNGSSNFSRLSGVGWLRRWWPVLAPASVSLACAVVCGLQQLEIHDLEQTLQALRGDAAARADAAIATTKSSLESVPGKDLASQEQEISRLKEKAETLAAEIKALEKLRLENQSLKRQLEASAGLTPEETEALAKAKEKALCVTCVNTMKQLGLAARMWSGDNHDFNPPDVLSISNYLSIPKILVCPADDSRQAAHDWASCGPANISYEYLAPSAKLGESEPQRVLFRCPIHGNVTLFDGSVQMMVGKEHPEFLVTRDGKLYFSPKDDPDPGSANK